MKRKIFVICLAGLIAVLSGQTALATETRSQTANGLDYSIGISLELYYIMLDIPDSLQTVLANPDDSPTGHTVTDLNNSYGFSCKLNSRLYLYDNGLFILYSGADLGFILSLRDYRQGIFDIEESDYGGESYAFTQLVPSYLSVSPVIGIGFNHIFFEVSFPYTSFELRSGNDRYGSWEEENSFYWQGFGQRYTLAVAGAESGDLYLGGIFYEIFPVNFDGHSAQINSIGLFMTHHFIFKK